MRVDEVGIYGIWILVDHEVRIDLVVERAAIILKRTPLQAEAVAQFDLIFGIIQQTIEPVVQMRDVIPAVEIVVDKNFPVAVEHVVTALKPMKTSEVQIPDLYGGRANILDSNKYPTLPDCSRYLNESHRPSIEATNPAKVGRSFQAPFERIRPAVIRTAQVRDFATIAACDGRRVMSAYIEKGAQQTVISADDDDTLACDFTSDVLARFLNLGCSSGDLPGSSEDCAFLEFSKFGIRIP